MDTWINLPYGGPGSGFRVGELVAHIKASGRDYIVEGAQQVAIKDHTKPHSLDYWLRTNATTYRDTKQMVRKVVDVLVATGLFREVQRPCPNTGRFCKSLELTNAAIEKA